MLAHEKEFRKLIFGFKIKHKECWDKNVYEFQTGMTVFEALEKQCSNQIQELDLDQSEEDSYQVDSESLASVEKNHDFVGEPQAFQNQNTRSAHIVNGRENIAQYHDGAYLDDYIHKSNSGIGTDQADLDESCLRLVPQSQMDQSYLNDHNNQRSIDGIDHMPVSFLDQPEHESFTTAQHVVAETQSEHQNDQDTAQVLVSKYFNYPNSTSLTKSLPQDTLKIQDLETTVAKLESDLSKMRILVTKLKRERDEWERKEGVARSEKDAQGKWMSQEMIKFKNEHEKEMKRLKKDRKDWELQRKLSAVLPTKREREEFETLKQIFDSEMVKWKEKEERLNLAQARFKKKITELEKKNKDLSDEISVLAKERASQYHVQIKENTSNAVPSKARMNKSKSTDMISTQSQQHSSKELKKNVYSKSDSNLSNAAPGQNQFEGERVPMIKKASRLIVQEQDYEPITSIEKNELVQEIMHDEPLIEKKKLTEFDAAKSDLDQLQRELGLGRSIQNISNEDGSRERLYKDGSKLLWLLDGTMRFSSSDGISVVYYSNGDSKTVYPDNRKVYWYNGPKTRHTTFPDGVQICEFEDGQVEKRYPDNTLIVEFPDKTVKTILPDGKEKIQYPDGMMQEIQADEKGTRIYNTYPDGIIELVTNDMTSKLYPNGIIKMTFANGTQETRWPDGKIRIKDAKGEIQTHVTKLPTAALSSQESSRHNV